jgi:hypothetical protein
MSLTHHKAGAAGHRCFSPALFDQLSSMLAEMVLEDLKQFPRLDDGSPIDTYVRPENTPPLSLER